MKPLDAQNSLFSVGSFRLGDRVEIGPHLDLWMMGARYGAVTGFGKRGRIRIKLDRVKRSIRLFPSDIVNIV